MLDAGVEVTESDWLAAQDRTRRMAWLSGLLGLLINPCLSLCAVWLSGEPASGGAGWWRRV